MRSLRLGPLRGLFAAAVIALVALFAIPRAHAHLGPSEALPGLGAFVDDVSTVRLTFPLELQAESDHKLLLSDTEGTLFDMGPTVQVNATTIEAQLLVDLPEAGPYIVRYTAWEAHEAGETASFSDGGYQFVFDPNGDLRGGATDDGGVSTGVLIGVGVALPLLALGVYVRTQASRAT